MRSLTRAAESLHLTHGAISHQIKSLEADLGVRLVERAGRGIRLTDEGERFATRVRACARGPWRCGTRGDRARQPAAAAGQRHACHSRPAGCCRGSAGFSRRIRTSISTSARINATWRTSSATMSTSRSATGSATGPAWSRSTCSTTPRFRCAARGWPTDGCRRVRRIYRATRCCDPKASPGNRGSRRPVWTGPSPRAADVQRFLAHRCRRPSTARASRLHEARFSATTSRNGVLVRLFDIVVSSPRKYFLVYPPRLARFAQARVVPAMAVRRGRRRDGDRRPPAQRRDRQHRLSLVQPRPGGRSAAAPARA